jgi:hypothetical protein
VHRKTKDCNLQGSKQSRNLIYSEFLRECNSDHPVWWPGLKNSPTITHVCYKRRMKWVPSAWGNGWATLSPEVTNTEVWSSGLGVGRWTNNPAPYKGYCYETPIFRGGYGPIWAVEPYDDDDDDDDAILICYGR